MRSDQCEILKVFNNNIVLAAADGKEQILMSKGIGFGRQSGDRIAAGTEVEKIFAMQDAENHDRFCKLLSQVNDETFRICQKIIRMIGERLGEELDENIHINLVDHIAFMVKRVMNGEQIHNPFLTEIELLYKTEFQLAEQAVQMLRQETKLTIPDGEIGFIAMHIHSARNQGKLSQTVKCAYLANSIVELIEEERAITIDRQSLDYARFITHVRFTVQRLTSNTPIPNDLLSTIKRKYKTSYLLARKISKMIAFELELKEVPEGEVGYIAIHIEKLCS
ncbi:PRD domain-containing protein [Azotosporobacter soli]|uniref:PRD domain-containing protein n=1 Tax=Azotosporobacter soli TaxID=3055040 RepID=UPI0031FF0389